MKDENVKPDNNQDRVSTKQKILVCAANLFAVKGFTETSIRELASAVGLQGASIYNHFHSKSAILEYMLDDYLVNCAGAFNDQDIFSKLQKNHTVDGIMDCLQLKFPEGREEYYLKILCVLLQEQHRNPIAKKFMAEQIILRAERDINTVIDILKKINLIHRDTDPDYWSKINSSLFYAFASRMMLGIGDSSPDFSGMNMVAMLRFTFELLLNTKGLSNNSHTLVNGDDLTPDNDGKSKMQSEVTEW